MKPKNELIRIVRTNQNKFLLGFKIDGRGAYICRGHEKDKSNMDCLQKCVKTRAFERSFKCCIPKEIYEKLNGEK